MNATPFLVFGLPRSMTAWTSCFLTCGEVFCQHELFGPKVTAREVAARLLGFPCRFSGIADPGALLHWRELCHELPTAPVVFVYRPLRASQEAFARAAGVPVERMATGYSVLNRMMRDLMQERAVRVMQMAELATEQGARDLWQFVAPGADLPEMHLRKMIALHVEQRPELIRAAGKPAQP